jgi:hypothetical protein
MNSDLVGYVSGPYTKGDVALNVAEAMSVAAWLMDQHVCVIVPHLSHFLHMAHPFPYHRWLEMDKVLLRRCDFLYRFPGISPGADMEIDEAIKCGVPVFYTRASCELFIRQHKRRLSQEEESACLTTKDH